MCFELRLPLPSRLLATGTSRLQLGYSVQVNSPGAANANDPDPYNLKSEIQSLQMSRVELEAQKVALWKDWGDGEWILRDFSDGRRLWRFCGPERAFRQHL